MAGRSGQHLMAAMALAVFAGGASVQAAGPSTVLTVLIDDLGFYDTAVHNPDIGSITPNLRDLAADGIRLDRHYVYKFCSPTRRAILSGRFPVHITGEQADVCSNCLPLNFSLISQKLAGAGWVNHFVGKGHLGYMTMDHLPINRGFVSHVGYLYGMENYSWGNHSKQYYSKDMWDGSAPGEQDIDEIYYSTNFYADRAASIIKEHPQDKNLFLHLMWQAVHAPYVDTPPWEQIPEATPFWDHTFGDMLYVMDRGMGNVTQALKDSGLWKNTLMVVSADNGGIGPGNNYPLRGHKMTPWEGGTRVMAFVTGGFLPPALRGTVSSDFIHVVDWYATILTLVGVDPTDTVEYNGVRAPIDGVDVWPMLTSANKTNPREWLPVTETSLIWKQQYKLLVGASSVNWYTPNCTQIPDNSTLFPCVKGNNATNCLVCSSDKPCLFDLIKDPGEYHNIAEFEPVIVKSMAAKLATYTPYVTCTMTRAELEPYNCSSPHGEAWGPQAGYAFRYAGPCCFKKSDSQGPEDA